MLGNDQSVSNHVERLHRYLPFSPSHDLLYEEYQDSNDSLNLQTVALAYIEGLIAGDARLIVLTGDAGHGKTHVCRRLVERHLDQTEEGARHLIKEKCKGLEWLEHETDPTVVRLRIVKDFSEIDEEAAARVVESVDAESEGVTIVCANEGRLRSVLASAGAGKRCKQLDRIFRESFESGVTGDDGETHIINLNYQSVAAGVDESLVGGTLKEWLKGTHWRVCQSCASATECPILRNRKMLRDEDSSEARRSRIAQIFEAAERLAQVVTIRELLMSVAFLLTGGLTCGDVHKRVGRGRGWQPAYAFYNLLFTTPPKFPRDRLSEMTVITFLQKLDPGLHASRVIDEELINAGTTFESGIDTTFKDEGSKSPDGTEGVIDASHGIDDIVIRNPSSKKERDREARFVERVVRSLRRRAFFDGVGDASSVLSRLGFHHGDEFIKVLSGTMEPRDATTLKTKLFAGLHTIQGLRLGSHQPNLYLVDPALGKSTAKAAILATTIAMNKVTLEPLSTTWAAESAHALSKSVDWLEHELRLSVADSEHALRVDLMMFDCIVRAAGGYVSEQFFDHEIRRIRTFLGRLAMDGGDGEEITLVLNGKMHPVSIDSTDVIMVGHD
jgi:hypothetical protein